VILFEFWFMMAFRVFIRRQIIGALYFLSDFFLFYKSANKVGGGKFIALF
jgi:hypothetical protein